MSPRKHVPLCSLRGRSPRRLLRAAVTTALVAAGVAALAQQPAAAAVQYTFYASPTGSGSTCSLAAPCSLTGAREKVRTVNAAMTGDIVVDLRGGTYALTSTFALTANGTVDDSGFNGHYSSGYTSLVTSWASANYYLASVLTQ